MNNAVAQAIGPELIRVDAEALLNSQCSDTANDESEMADPDSEYRFPVLAEDALDGLAGDVVRAIEPHT